MQGRQEGRDDLGDLDNVSVDLAHVDGLHALVLDHLSEDTTVAATYDQNLLGASSSEERNVNDHLLCSVREGAQRAEGHRPDKQTHPSR
jgi:hypothetical protein